MIGSSESVHRVANAVDRRSRKETEYRTDDDRGITHQYATKKSETAITINVGAGRSRRSP